MPEIPCQHLLFLSLNEVLCSVGNREKGKLPVLVQAGYTKLWRNNTLVAKAWKSIFRKDSSFHQRAILGVQCSGQAVTFIMRYEIGLIDIQEVEDAF